MCHSTQQLQQLQLDIPQVKLCECGYGQPAPLAKQNDKRIGHVKGQPIRFIRGHNPTHREVRPVTERFWKKVDKRGPNDCWPWTAHTKSGYGELRIDGANVYAHRFSWELHNGPIPDGMFVCHSCDRKRCTNPNHLFIGTPQENIQDMLDKERQQRGTRHWRSKLTPEDVRRIRALRETGMILEDIAAQIGVSRTTVWTIVKGKTWSHVT